MRWIDRHGNRLRGAGLAAATFSASLAGCAGNHAGETGVPARPPQAGLMVDGAAVLVGPDVISTEWSEVRYSRSPDGRWAVWGSTDRPGGMGGWEIWIAECATEVCTAPRPAAVNSTANDFDPAFARDGRTLLFFSNRPGGLGGDDIYAAPFDPATGVFGAPANLGAAINSTGDEWAPALSADGQSLLFATDGRGGAGRHDLFTARRNGSGGWSAAQPLPGKINSPDDEFDATWLSDGETLVFARSADADSQPISLYWSRAAGGKYERGESMGEIVNVAEGWNLGPLRDWRDPDLLYFSSHHAAARRGKLDIYAVRYRLQP